MLPLVGSVLAASLLGSAHCAAMCGPFACLATGGGERPSWRGQAAYQAGRLAAYLLLGTLAGLTGLAVGRAGAAAGLPRAAALVAGALMIGWGIATILAARGVRVPGTAAPPALRRALGLLVKRTRERPPAVRALLLGLATALLPCGWLYAFVAVALGAGTAAGGALVMAAFWLGGVPVLAGVGLASQLALGPLRKRLPVATAAVLVVLGLLTMAGRMTPTPVVPPSTGVHATH